MRQCAACTDTWAASVALRVPLQCPWWQGTIQGRFDQRGADISPREEAPLGGIPWPVPGGILVRLILAGLAGSAAVSLGFRLGEFQQPPLLYLRDFVQDWLWARALRDGLAPYDPTTVLAKIYLGDCCLVHLPHASPHPPLAGLLVLPLSWLDLGPASLVWAGIEVMCLAIAVKLLARQPWAVAGVLTGLLLAWHAARTEIVHGQFTTVQLLLLALAWRALGARHDVCAGILIGLALALKPILAPVALLLAVQRRQSTLAGVGAAAGGIGLLSLLLLGPANVNQYLSQLPETGQLYQGYGLNISVWAIGWKITPDDASLAASVSLVGGLLALTGLGALLLRARDPELAFGAAIAGSTILTPIAWDIYALLTLIPVAQVLRSLQQRGWPRRESTLLFVLGVGALVPPLPEAHLLLTLIPTTVLLGFAGYLGFLAARSPTPERAPMTVSLEGS